MASRTTKGAAQAAPAPRKSGANIPESQRTTVQLKLRVSAEVVTQLDALCQLGEPDAWTRSDLVSALVEAESGRVARKNRKA
ncbi:MAG TPA: hypothetical protein VGJ91_20020 [Polyangiaceae bacterium]|jgi:hypothetical protein